MKQHLNLLTLAALALVALAALPGPRPAWAGSTSYAMTALPAPGDAPQGANVAARRVNAGGLVIGEYFDNLGHPHAVVWTPVGNGDYTSHSLPEPNPPLGSDALDVSDDGFIVGFCIVPDPHNPNSSLTVACGWAPVSGGYQLFQLPLDQLFPGQSITFSQVTAIAVSSSNSGTYEIAGTTDNAAFTGWVAPVKIDLADLSQSRIFQAAGLPPASNFAHSVPERVNAGGQVAGNSNGQGRSTATQWTTSIVTDPFPPNLTSIHVITTTNLGQNLADSSDASAINSSGQVAGTFVRSNGLRHPYRLAPSQLIDPAGAGQDLGLFPGAQGAQGGGFANDMNDSGAVVGTDNMGFAPNDAFVYTDDGGLEDLNDDVPGIGTAHLHAANGINAAGQIVGAADTGPGTPLAGFLLTPSAAPATPLASLTLSQGQNSGTSLTVLSGTAFDLKAALASSPDAKTPVFLQAVATSSRDNGAKELRALGFSTDPNATQVQIGSVPAGANPFLQVSGTAPRLVGGAILEVTLRASTTRLPDFDPNQHPEGSIDVKLKVTPLAVGRVTGLALSAVDDNGKPVGSPETKLTVDGGAQFAVQARILNRSVGETHVIVTTSGLPSGTFPTTNGQVFAVVPDGASVSLPLIGRAPSGNATKLTGTITAYAESDLPSHSKTATLVVNPPPPPPLVDLSLLSGTDRVKSLNIQPDGFFTLIAALDNRTPRNVPVYLQALDSKKKPIDMEAGFEMGTPNGFTAVLVIPANTAVAAASGQVYVPPVPLGKVTIQASTTPFSSKPKPNLIKAVTLNVKAAPGP